MHQVVIRPTAALALVDAFPEFGMTRCVTCFCCLEMCPEKVMQPCLRRNAGRWGHD